MACWLNRETSPVKSLKSSKLPPRISLPAPPITISLPPDAAMLVLGTTLGLTGAPTMSGVVGLIGP